MDAIPEPIDDLWVEFVKAYIEQEEEKTKNRAALGYKYKPINFKYHIY